MTGHHDACSGSACLCNDLFDGLSEKIPNLKRERKQESCAIFQDGKNRFAYVYHYKTSGQITVWCRGDIAKLHALTGGTFRPRQAKSGVWRDFPGSFKVNGRAGIAAAVKCLIEESYSQTRNPDYYRGDPTDLLD